MPRPPSPSRRARHPPTRARRRSRARLRRARRARSAERRGRATTASARPAASTSPNQLLPRRPTLRRRGPADTSPSVWAAEVAPDLAYFERVASEALAFPHAEAARTIALDATRIRIGRRARPGEDAPEIELDDPAVSRLHATLVHAPDGAWAIVDERSSNGTTLNDDNDPIPPHLEVPLREGDRVHVGAWTTITLALRSRAA